MKEWIKNKDFYFSETLKIKVCSKNQNIFEMVMIAGSTRQKSSVPLTQNGSIFAANYRSRLQDVLPQICVGYQGRVICIY